MDLTFIASHFLHWNECCPANIIFLQKIKAFLTGRNIFHHDIIQTAATSWYGHIVFGINAAQVTLIEWKNNNKIGSN